MKNTLLVSYLPKAEFSNTKNLLDAFLKQKKIEKHLDLLKELPSFFDISSMSSYIKRNYMGQSLNKEELLSIKKMDDMTQQFLAADLIVFVFPMHNFSMPASVKAYFDSIIQKGKTFDIVEGKYIGLAKNKKALVLTSSGGVYEGAWKAYDHLSTLTTELLNFMGISDVRIISAKGMGNPLKCDENILNAVNEVKNYVNNL